MGAVISWRARPKTSCAGAPPSEATFARAGQIAAEHCAPAADQRGPEDYKRHLTAELTTRALRRAAARARGRRCEVEITMTVNGATYTRDVEPRMLLIHFLRDELELTGSHWGCDTSNCGACVIWLDGAPVKSCTALAAMAAGRESAP